MQNRVGANGFLHAICINAHQEVVILIICLSADKEPLSTDGRLAKREHFNGSCQRSTMCETDLTMRQSHTVSLAQVAPEVGANGCLVPRKFARGAVNFRERGGV